MIADETTILRAPEARDEELLFATRNDVTVQLMLLARPRPSSPARVWEWVNRVGSDPSSVFFVVAAVESGEAVGFCQITEMDLINGSGRLGIAIHPGHTRRGHGRATIRLVGPYLRDVFGIRKLILDVRTDNDAALALYRSVGFREVGVLVAHHRVGDAFLNVIVMEMFLGS